MKARGYKDEDVFCGTVVDPIALSDPDCLISHEDHQTLLGNMIRLTGDSGLGLELGSTVDIPNFSVLAYAGMSCRTIRDGMKEIWSRYGRAFGVNVDPSVVEENEDWSVIELSAPRINDAIYRFSIEEALFALSRFGGALTGDSIPFIAISFAYPKPSYSDRYTEFFHCPITFGAPCTFITVHRRWLDSEFKTNDAALNQACRDYLDRALKQAQKNSPLSLRLRQYLLARVDGMPSISEAAKAFGMSSRTLARQLQQQGCTYRVLTEEIRIELAQRWLNSGQLSAKEVGYRLGFSDVVTFRRAFKGWTGKTIGEYCTAPHNADTSSANDSR